MFMNKVVKNEKIVLCKEIEICCKFPKYDEHYVII